MQNLTIATLQTDLTWENPTANFSHITEQLAAVEAPFDLWSYLKCLVRVLP